MKPIGLRGFKVAKCDLEDCSSCVPLVASGKAERCQSCADSIKLGTRALVDVILICKDKFLPNLLENLAVTICDRKSVDCSFSS